MNSAMNRRRFLGTTAFATSAFTVVPRRVLGGNGRVAPNDKLVMAHIGMGTQSISELGGLLEDPKIQIVAVCDPNRDSQDYVEWGRNSIRNRIRDYLGNPTWREGREGCPGGREVGREVIDTYYARRRETDKFRSVRTYVDFRDLLDKEQDIDAVKVMTPDHLHATVAIAAMKRGRHVLMHKPMANRVAEGRLVVKTARETGRETHLLAYGSGADNARIAGRIKEGVIGRLREIHNWTNRPVWPQYTEIPTDRPPVPPGFEWDLWLGPALDRPYHPHYTHTVFRGWYEFGGGSMADMGIYSLWPVFTGLDLPSAISAEAAATHTCTIVDQVSRTVENDFAYPAACTLRFKFPATAARGAVELFWYDGGMRPRLPDFIEAQNPEMGREGILFLGDKGAILAEFRGANPRVYTEGRNEPLWQGGDAGWGNNQAKWVGAFTGGESSPGSFLNAQAITDTVNLGTVALRAGRRVEFDPTAMRITNVESANRFLTREYRKGWELA
ncbi:MAG: Gfo/Idh/MocA family oxidoreductase [Verrucomicrobiales bacterium]|nr:Gfo/Idh/MocA family oxidoreductase [Verrucomicrobiales bacterium]